MEGEVSSKYHKMGEVSSKSGLVLEKYAEMCLKYA